MKSTRHEDKLETPLARVVVGALRSAIHDHGPITLERIDSAAKRILGQLANMGESADLEPRQKSKARKGP